jgi:hypothetical protein
VAGFLMFGASGNHPRFDAERPILSRRSPANHFMGLTQA